MGWVWSVSSSLWLSVLMLLLPFFTTSFAGIRACCREDKLPTHQNPIGFALQVCLLFWDENLRLEIASQPA